jgi:hypothetical protein
MKIETEILKNGKNIMIGPNGETARLQKYE